MKKYNVLVRIAMDGKRFELSEDIKAESDNPQDLKHSLRWSLSKKAWRDSTILMVRDGFAEENNEYRKVEN